MWLLGLLLGLVVGAQLGGFTGALSGALLGALAGAVLKSIITNPGHSTRTTEERIRSLEDRVNLLNHLVVELQARLDRRGEPPSQPASTDTIAPSSSMPAADAAPIVDEMAVPDIVNPPSELAEPAVATPRGLGPTATMPQPPAPSASYPSTLENAFWARLFGGNILARIGVVLLFFGIASGLKLAAQYGLFPIPIRLLLGALAAAGMVAFGWNRVQRPPHRMFGLALQGGGFAILYLIVFFMLGRYQMIDTRSAFVLFAALGVGCLTLAALEDGMSLAVLGISGAFMAPVLAAPSSGSHVLLFSYYALLNTFIIGVNWVKGWRGLNVCGFLFTFLIGMVWGTHGYSDELFESTEAFLILYFVMYSLTPVAFALFKAPGTRNWTESTVIFGTPLAAAFSQSFLMRPYEYGLAWSALACGGYYLALWWALHRRRDATLQGMERSQLAIAVVLLTLAVPLAFGVALTSALWAFEGMALVWLGTTQQRRLALGFGLLMQLASGLHFAGAFIGNDLLRPLPVLNSACVGALILACTGLASAWFLRRMVGASANWRWLRVLALLWGLLWWFGAGRGEIAAFVPLLHENAWLLAFTALSALVLEHARRALAWDELGATALILTVAQILLALDQADGYRHPLAGAMLFVLPLAIAAHHWILARHERDSIDFFATARHLAILWLAVFVLGKEFAWLAAMAAPDNSLWPVLAWGISGAAAMLLTLLAIDKSYWPAASRPGAYLHIGLAPIAALLAMWSVYGNLTQSGEYGWPYVPLANPFDLTQLLILIALVRWIRALAHGGAARTEPLTLLVQALGFLWISMLAARLGHYWDDVPLRFSALFDSLFVQSALSLLWTGAAITLMISATRLANRRRWFLGFALLGLVGAKLMLVDLAHVGTIAWTASLIGVALLVLAASYFSPAPPRVSDLPKKAYP